MKHDVGGVNNKHSIGMSDTSLSESYAVAGFTVHDQSFQVLAANLPFPVFRIDKNLKHIYVNPAYCTTMGKRPEELLGKPCLEFLPDATLAPEFARLHQSVFDEARGFQKEVRFPPESGNRYLIKAEPEFDEDGRVESSLVMCFELRSLHACEQALDMNKEQHEAGRWLEGFEYKSLFDQAPVGVLLVDTNGTVQQVNPEASRLLGYDQAEMAGLTANDVMHPDDRKEVSGTMASIRSGNTVRRNRRYLRKNGEYLEVESEARLVADNLFQIVFKEVGLAARTNNLLTSVVEAVPAGISVYDTDFTILLWSAGMEKITGMHRGDAVGRNLFESFPSLDEQRWREMYAAVMHAGDVVQLFKERLVIPELSKVEYFVNLTAMPLRDSFGGPTGVVVVVEDITERTHAENNLKQTKERLELALDAAQMGLWEWDPQTNRIELFGRHMELSEIDPEEYRGTVEDTMSRVHPDDIPASQEAVRRTVQEGVDFYNEYRVLCRDGGTRWLVTFGSPIRDAQGNTVMVMGATQDITRRKQMEAAHKESEAKFKLISEQSLLALGFIQDGVFKFVNRSLAELVETTPEAMCAWPPYRMLEYVHPEDRDRVREQLLKKERGETQGIIPRYTYRIITETGRIRWLDHFSKTVEYDGKPADLIALVDITHKKLAEEDLRRAKNAAEEADKVKTQFLANMSHELRTPLNGIIGMLNLLELSNLDGEQREFAANAIQSSKNLLTLLNDILDLSKIEAGRLEIVEEAFDPAAVIRDVVSIFRSSGRHGGPELIESIDKALPTRVLGDPGRLRQILFNLVGNAVKFTEQGRVEVAVQALENSPDPNRIRLLFQVRDTGPGIDDSQLEAVFEPFRQADGSYTRKFQGAGLGLGIVKRLIQMMNGSMSVETEPSRGACFHFCIGFGRSDHATGPAPEPKTMLNAANIPLTILVAEDNPINRAAAGFLLIKRGYNVLEAANGAAALDVLAEEKVDLVLMDIQMPIMSGVEAVKTIREGNAGCDPNIPVVALTAYAMKGDREKLLDYGMDAYLSKPFEPADLDQVIHRISLDKSL